MILTIKTKLKSKYYNREFQEQSTKSESQKAETSKTEISIWRPTNTQACKL